MVSTGAIVGLVILIVGLIIGAYAVAVPEHPTVLSQTLNVDGNGYQSANINMTAGQRAFVQVSIANNTIITFDIMNRTQYYNYYGCAPFCHNGTNVAGCGCNVSNALAAPAYLSNVTVTPSSPASIAFTAPSTGTYYFIFDNTVGPNYSCYISYCLGSMVSPSATFPTVTTFTVSGYAVNWTLLGLGAGLLILGGLIATILWTSGRRRTLPSKPAAPSS
jgi:hypothetical protein